MTATALSTAAEVPPDLSVVRSTAQRVLGRAPARTTCRAMNKEGANANLPCETHDQLHDQLHDTYRQARTSTAGLGRRRRTAKASA